MSVPFALARSPRLPFRRRATALVAVGAAGLLTRLSPARIAWMLRLLRTGSRPADVAQASVARTAVTTVSVYCAGEGCLQRSIATVLLCRLRGTWPDWHVGVRTEPFGAHAWVAVDGNPVDEPYPAGYHRTILAVPAG